MKTSNVESKSNLEPSNPVYMDAEDRHRMISEAAYYIAECRGFSGGCPADDWFKAEAEINRTHPMQGEMCN
ncbi:MAG: hypothetical protein RL333_38 [Pseudomonadota bacterium]